MWPQRNQRDLAQRAIKRDELSTIPGFHIGFAGMLDWDAIGAVGEIVGAFAVVVTLLVLVKEMRTNTNTIRLQSGREVAFGLSEWHREIVKDPELMRIFLKSTQNPIADYTDEEWNKFNFLAKTLWHQIEAGYVSKELRLSFSDQDEGYLSAARTLLDTYPAWHKFWSEESATGFWSPGFIEELNRSDVGSMEGIRTIGPDIK